MWQLWALAFVISVGAAASLLPFWATGLVVLGWFVGGMVAGRSYSKAVSEGVARSRGFVLKDSTVLVDEVNREALTPELMRLTITLTITPRAGNSQLRPWQPRDLRLQIPETTQAFAPDSIERDSPGTFAPYDGTDLKGKQRLRLTTSVPPDTRALFLGYHLEELAQLDVEPAPPAPHGKRA